MAWRLNYKPRKETKGLFSLTKLMGESFCFFIFFLVRYTCTQWVLKYDLTLPLELIRREVTIELELIDIGELLFGSQERPIVFDEQ